MCHHYGLGSAEELRELLQHADDEADEVDEGSAPKVAPVADD